MRSNLSGSRRGWDILHLGAYVNGPRHSSVPIDWHKRDGTRVPVEALENLKLYILYSVIQGAAR